MKGKLVQFEETEYVEKNRQFTAYKFMHAITVFQVNISLLFIFVLHKNINTRVINICLDWLREWKLYLYLIFLFLMLILT